MQSTPVLAKLLRWLIGVVLIWAAVSKLANLQEFFSGLIAYQTHLPLWLLKAIAISLPWLELLCGLMLLTRIQLPAALLWATLLFGAFTLATAQAWARGLQISCSCLSFDFLGRESTSLARFLESPAFACLRSLLLCAATAYLFKKTPSPKHQAPVNNQASGSK